MYDYKKDSKGNVLKQDRLGHTDYIGKVHTGYSGEYISTVINNYGNNVGTIKNPLNPTFDGQGNMNVNFNSVWPAT